MTLENVADFYPQIAVAYEHGDKSRHWPYAGR
jgi:hypothetical protein